MTNEIVARHSGAVGDIVYAVPYLKAIGSPIRLLVGELTHAGNGGQGGANLPRHDRDLMNRLYPSNMECSVPAGYGNHQAVSRLLQRQPWCAGTAPAGSDPVFELDCDSWRSKGYNGHLADRQLLFYNRRASWRTEPQLVNIERDDRYSRSLICCRSHRYIVAGSERASEVAKAIAAKAEAMNLSPVFVGLPSEHTSFVRDVMDIPLALTSDLYDVAKIVAAAPFGVYNASAPLAIAAMLCRPRAIERSFKVDMTVLSGAPTEETI